MKTEIEQAGQPLNTKALNAAAAAIKGKNGVGKNFANDTLALAIVTYLNTLRDMSADQRQAEPLRVEQPPRLPRGSGRRPDRNVT